MTSEPSERHVCTIRPATPDDTPLILTLIHELADYEKLSDDVIATEDMLRESLFGAAPSAECVIAEIVEDSESVPVGFALFFHNYSTFHGKKGLYLEDLFVTSEYRGKGFGAAMLTYLAKIAIERNCARFEWAVLDWNEAAIRFYQKLGAKSMNEWMVFRVTGEALEKLATGADQ